MEYIKQIMTDMRKASYEELKELKGTTGTIGDLQQTNRTIEDVKEKKESNHSNSQKTERNKRTRQDFSSVDRGEFLPFSKIWDLVIHDTRIEVNKLFYLISYACTGKRHVGQYTTGIIKRRSKKKKFTYYSFRWRFFF